MDEDIFPGDDIKVYWDATKELNKVECFLLAKGYPILISKAFSVASSKYYWNKRITIGTKYSDFCVASNFFDLVWIPEILTPKNIRDQAGINWTKVDFSEKLYIVHVLSKDRPCVKGKQPLNISALGLSYLWPNEHWKLPFQLSSSNTCFDLDNKANIVSGY